MEVDLIATEIGEFDSEDDESGIVTFNRGEVKRNREDVNNNATLADDTIKEGRLEGKLEKEEENREIETDSSSEGELSSSKSEDEGPSEKKSTSESFACKGTVSNY